jgi:hypothetical protein
LDEQATGGQRSEKIGNADGEQTTGDNKQDFEANNARPHGGAMGERPRGMQRALAGFWVAWGMTATLFSPSTTTLYQIYLQPHLES